MTRSLDVRTRVDGPVEPIGPESFFGTDLAEHWAVHADLLAPACAFLPLRPLTIEVGERAWTLELVDGRPVVVAGSREGSPTLRLDAEQLSDLVADQTTPVTWMVNGTLEIHRGRLDDALNWWLVIRGALDGEAPWVPGSIDLGAGIGAGATPDLGRAFGVDDDPDEMAAFLHRLGYLHLAAVFTPDEMAAVSADMDRFAPEYSPGDGRSWWARLGDGSDRLVRMQGFDRLSVVVASLLDDDRLARIGELFDDGHRISADGSNRIEALFKPIGVIEGISDVPWHKDCSLGRHSYDCCSLTVGISVTGADATSGQLRVVAGSHRARVWPSPILQPGLDLPVVDLATASGDVTVHSSCTLHMAQPPVDRERRVLYTSFFLPPIDPQAARIAKARLGRNRELAPVTVSQPPAPQPPANVLGVKSVKKGP